MPSPAVVRPPAVAGTFYPGEPKALTALVDGLLDAATVGSGNPASAAAGATAAAAPTRVRHGTGPLVALICPHAGYRYSGPVAASAYRILRGKHFKRVVILSPSHRMAFSGLALPDCDAFETPLGRVPIWPGCRALAEGAPFILDSRPHADEHAIEVQLPFLQRTLGDFELVPIVFGVSDAVVDHRPLLSLCDAHTLFIVSTDLSHYMTYEAAKLVDAETLSNVLQRNPSRVAASEACGRGPMAALLGMALQRDWQLELLDYRTSGDTGGDRSRVVGYAAIAATASESGDERDARSLRGQQRQ